MAILPTDGRIALVEHLAKATMHFAWGTGEDWWDSSHRTEIALDAAGRASLPYAPVISAVVSNADGGAVYQAGVDYTISSGGELIRRPQGDMPEKAVLIVEYSSGRPSLTGAEHGLAAEIGRRRANTVVSVTPDENGEIETPGGKRWRLSNAPTRYLYIAANFGFSDAPDATIREIAVFTDTTAIDDVPPGQLYLTPDQIGSAGRLLLLDRLKPIFRSPAELRSFAYVVTI